MLNKILTIVCDVISTLYYKERYRYVAPILSKWDIDECLFWVVTIYVLIKYITSRQLH